LRRLVDAASAELDASMLLLEATGLAYATLISLVPFLAVTFSLLKAFGAHNRIEPVLAQALEPLGPRGLEVTHQIISFVDNLKVGVLGIVGVLGLLFTVVTLVERIENALNRIWRVRQGRRLSRKFTDYLSVVLVGPVLVFAAFALTATVQSHWIVRAVREVEPVGRAIFVATQIAPIVFVCIAFTFLYKFLPNTRVRLASALVGGLIGGLLWHIAGFAFTTFVADSARYTAIYSSFAILILFLIWLYVGWIIVLVGAEVAYFHQYPASFEALATGMARSHAFREQVGLAALLTIARRHLAAEPPLGATQLAAALRVPRGSAEEVIEEFVRRQFLLRTTEPEGLTLGRPPEQIAVADVLESLRGGERTSGTAAGVVRGQDQAAMRTVVAALARRDEAARRGLDGLTLRSLITEGGLGEAPPREPVAPSLPGSENR
jgi:membrane protein